MVAIAVNASPWAGVVGGLIGVAYWASKPRTPEFTFRNKLRWMAFGLGIAAFFFLLTLFD